MQLDIEYIPIFGGINLASKLFDIQLKETKFKLKFSLEYLIKECDTNVFLHKEVRRYPDFMFKWKEKTGIYSIVGRSIRRAFYETVIPTKIFAEISPIEPIASLSKAFAYIPLNTDADVVARIPVLLCDYIEGHKIYINPKRYGYIIASHQAFENLHEDFMDELRKIFIF